MKKEETYFQQSNGQLALFQPDFIRDADCTKDTPVIYGKPDVPIYGTGKESGRGCQGAEILSTWRKFCWRSYCRWKVMI